MSSFSFSFSFSFPFSFSHSFLASRHRQRLCGIPISLPLVACNKIFSRGRQVAGGQVGAARRGFAGLLARSSVFRLCFSSFLWLLSYVTGDLTELLVFTVFPSSLRPVAHHKIRICIRVWVCVCVHSRFGYLCLSCCVCQVFAFQATHTWKHYGLIPLWALAIRLLYTLLYIPKKLSLSSLSGCVVCAVCGRKLQLMWQAPCSYALLIPNSAKLSK